MNGQQIFWSRGSSYGSFQLIYATSVLLATSSIIVTERRKIPALLRWPPYGSGYIRKLLYQPIKCLTSAPMGHIEVGDDNRRQHGPVGLADAIGPMTHGGRELGVFVVLRSCRFQD